MLSAKEPAQPARGLRRHLEGWQAGAVAIWIGYLSAALAVPRPAEPRDLPAPEPDRSVLSWEMQQQRELASAARAEPLPFDVRAVGELLRRYGKQSARAKTDAAEGVLADLRQAAHRAFEREPVAKLEKLRAIQSELFLSALRSWEAGADTGAELEELGGNLLQKAQQNAWLDGRRLAMSEVERAVFFRIRWSELTGLRQRAPFVPSLDDWRVYYRFLLENPEEPRDAGAVQVRRASYVEALVKRDPSYPALLARGILLYQAGQNEQAADLFRAHLEQSVSGEYALRARNYLLATLARAEASE